MKQLRQRVGLVLLMVGLVWGMVQVPPVAAEIGEVKDDAVNPFFQPARTWTGDTYSVLFTDEMAAEIVDWVLAEHPDLPFREAQVAIHEDGITGSGFLQVGRLQIAASGRVSVYVENGRLQGRVEEMQVAGLRVPALLLKAIADVTALYEQVTWEIVVTNVELREGEMLLEGIVE